VNHGTGLQGSPALSLGSAPVAVKPVGYGANLQHRLEIRK
jgi:hypothetical protein